MGVPIDPTPTPTATPTMESESTQNGHSKTPRLFISKMEMENFKSYAGKQIVGPFHKSFSAVVGPNGSGKSNVIDAMLFVFGKRAKQMRLNKVSELIHNSTNHQNLDCASVTVYFQEIIDLEGETYEVVPGSEFSVTRKAYRTEKVEYFINNHSSTYTLVTKKLKEKGVDLDNNRFLILQGEVEQISLMKPKAQGPHDLGFLEYIEDIIGTNKYVEPIEELSKELETLTEKRTGVVEMVKLAEKERNSLEDVKNEAEAYMLKEWSLLKWKDKATNLASEENSAQMGELQAKLSQFEENLKSEREMIKENKNKLKKLEVMHSEKMKFQEELDSDLKHCRDEFKEFERLDVKHREDFKHVKQKIKKLDDKLEKDSVKITEIEKESEESTNLIPQLEGDIPKLQKLLSDEESLLEEIKENAKVETEIYRSELTKVRAELEPWEKQLIEHKGKLDVASNESKLLNDKHEAGRAAYEDAKRQLCDIHENIETKTASLKEIQSELEKSKLQVLEQRKVEQDCLKEQDQLIPLEQSARQKVTELVSVMESEKSQGSVLKAIMQAKESNEISGIYGRMGDLGAIDGKYDVAISTACPGLDYVVVETTAAAQACVELLRRKNLGVATFMILEKQVNHLSRINEKVKTPEGVPRLFDLITVKDERIKLAFFAAMGNTVVAKDIDQATRIAYGGDREFRRVVTLEGALFEKSGTMSGGGGRPRGGKMGTSIRVSSVSREAVTDAEKELSLVLGKLDMIRQKINDAARSYQSSEKAISHLEMELAKCQKEVDSLKSQHAYLEKQLDSLKDASKPSNDELEALKKLTRIISGEENEIARITESSKNLKEKASELQNKIENAGGEKLKGQILKVKNIQSDIDTKSTEINRHKVQIETGKKMIKKLTKGIEDSKTERERISLEKEKLLANFKEIEQKAFAVQENYKKTQERIDQHKDGLEKAKSEYEELKKTVDELRASEVDADYKLKDMKKLYKDLEIKGKGYSKQIDDLENATRNQLEQIKKDLVDPEKLQETLADASLHEACDLKRGMEMVVLLESQLKEMNPNLESISEYRKKVSLYNERVEELDSITQQRDEVKERHDELRKKRLDEFMAGYNAISLKLKEMYQMITLGGDAELELVDSLDPFSEGIVFSVRPPKKSWKCIGNLSGGEKTLSSLALVFALHHYKPTPLYVMDEIDAALDFKNVSIVGHYVKDRTKNAQFVIISLRNNMFELADRLVGIYKTDNCTKSITINPTSFEICQKSA